MMYPYYKCKYWRHVFHGRLFTQVRGCKCKLFDSSHTSGSPQAMEGVATALDLVFLLYFG